MCPWSDSLCFIYSLSRWKRSTARLTLDQTFYRSRWRKYRGIIISHNGSWRVSILDLDLVRRTRRCNQNYSRGGIACDMRSLERHFDLLERQYDASYQIEVEASFRRTLTSGSLIIFTPITCPSSLSAERDTSTYHCVRSTTCLPFSSGSRD